MKTKLQSYLVGPLPQFQTSWIAPLIMGIFCLFYSIRAQALSELSLIQQAPGQALVMTVDGKTVNYWQAPSLKPATTANVLITHEVGFRFDSEHLIKGLISHLAQRGYRVVSLATPSLDPSEINDKDRVEKFEGRLLNQLNQVMGEAFSDTQYKRFILSHGRSSFWLGKLLGQSELKVHGFAAISTYYPEPLTNAQIPAHLAKLNCFVLDIYAARAPLWSLQTVQTRRALSAPRGSLYRQLLIENADHSFHLLENLLVNRIDGWMRTSLREGKSRSQ